MPATPSDISAAIPAGTFAQGDRQNFTANLQTALGDQGSGAVQPTGSVPTSSTAVSGSDPLAALISGDLDPGGDEVPLTDGLSVGPGKGLGGDAPLDPRRQRLMEIISQASSPVLRSSARMELRLLEDEPV